MPSGHCDSGLLGSEIMPASASSSLAKVLSELQVDPDVSSDPIIAQAIALARVLQERGVTLQTPQERRQQRELERMMEGEQDRITLMQLTDQAFRSTRAKRVANQLVSKP